MLKQNFWNKIKEQENGWFIGQRTISSPSEVAQSLASVFRESRILVAWQGFD
jgi:hypothetical protein